MKQDIHPKWYPTAKVTCACGHTFVVGAVKPELRVEICSNCHPFYTGAMKFVDTMGKVERFQQKQKVGAAQAVKLAEKKKKKAERERELRSPKSLKDMLMGVK